MKRRGFLAGLLGTLSVTLLPAPPKVPALPAPPEAPAPPARPAVPFDGEGNMGPLLRKYRQPLYDDEGPSHTTLVVFSRRR